MKTVLAAVAAVAAGAALALGSGLALSPADAAQLPTCYRTTGLDSGHIGDIDVPSAGTTDASTSCLMSRGANSNAVKRLQYTLKICYGRNIAVDGDFGRHTEDALKYAQRVERDNGNYHGQVDGEYGPLTRDGIDWATGPDPHWNCWSVDGPGGS
jgi:hypothetical protein